MSLITQKYNRLTEQYDEFMLRPSILLTFWAINVSMLITSIQSNDNIRSGFTCTVQYFLRIIPYWQENILNPFLLIYPFCCVVFCVSARQQIGWLVDCRLERKGQSFEATQILNREHARSVLWFFLGNHTGFVQSLADWCPVDIFCLIICTGTGTRGGAQEWSAERTHFTCVEVIKNSVRVGLTQWATLF